MTKIDRLDIEFRRKTVYESGNIMVYDKLDCISNDPRPYHTFYFKVEKAWTLGGVKWTVKVPDFSSTSTSLFEAIRNAMLHINSNGPEISRLQDWITSRKKK